MVKNRDVGYVGWRLGDQTRAQLLDQFPPRYDQVLAHHCTCRYGVSSSVTLPEATKGLVIGVVDDSDGVQALVLEISGSNIRPGGGIFHVTWSLDHGRRPVESNQVISRFAWVLVKPPVEIDLIPEFFPVGN
jgi:hypothetical protein